MLARNSLGRLTLALVTVACLAACSGAPREESPPPDVDPTATVVLPPKPADVPQEAWARMFGPTPAEWAPQGTVAADSGFQPWRDSFGFFNYGATLAPNNHLGYPEAKPVNMTVREAVRMYGRGICVNVRAGRCRISGVARMWMQGANGMSAGGHCFGFAALVSQLFEKTFPRTSITTSSANSEARLTGVMQKEIAYWFSTQTSAPSDTIPGSMAPPADIVNTLRTGLTAGKLPWVLVLLFPSGGGHAVTPYALYDRGDGQFDIAVYDNNYPLRARAVHVDTNANTWSYLVAANPTTGDNIVQGDANSASLGLVPVAKLVGRQPCTVCRQGDAGATQVMLAPLSLSAEPVDVTGIEVRVVGRDGRAIPGTVERPSVSPNSPWPSFEVPDGVPFVLQVDGRKASQSAAVSATVAMPGGSLTSPTLGVRKGGSLYLGVDPDLVSMTVLRGEQAGIVINGSVETRGDSYTLDLSEQVRTSTGFNFSTAMNPRKGEAQIAGVSEKSRTSLELTRVSARYKESSISTGNVILRRGDIVIVRYGTWTGRVPPQAWILRGRNQKVPLRFTAS